MSTQQPVDPNQIQAAVAGAIRAHATFFLVEGIVLVILGMLAIGLPLFAALIWPFGTMQVWEAGVTVAPI